MRQVDHVEEALVHADADQEVVVDRVTLVAALGYIVEPDQTTVQSLYRRVRAIDGGPERRNCRAESRTRPARRSDRGVRALHRADKVARQSEGAVEFLAVDGTVRWVEDVVQFGTEIFCREIGNVHARAVKVFAQVFVADQERHAQVGGDATVAFLYASSCESVEIWDCLSRGTRDAQRVSVRRRP